MQDILLNLNLNGLDSDATFLNTGIDRLAKKYKQRSEQSAPDLAEHGRQSWASSSSNGSLPSALKRKFRSEEFGADRTELGYKRSRAGTGDLPTA